MTISSSTNSAPAAEDPSAPPSSDLGAIKGRQQATWASGDYHMIGTQITIVSELLIEALDLHSTERVLDSFGLSYADLEAPFAR